MSADTKEEIVQSLKTGIFRYGWVVGGRGQGKKEAGDEA